MINKSLELKAKVSGVENKSVGLKTKVWRVKNKSVGLRLFTLCLHVYVNMSFASTHNKVGVFIKAI